MNWRCEYGRMGRRGTRAIVLSRDAVIPPSLTECGFPRMAQNALDTPETLRLLVTAEACSDLEKALPRLHEAGGIPTQMVSSLVAAVLPYRSPSQHYAH